MRTVSGRGSRVNPTSIPCRDLAAGCHVLRRTAADDKKLTPQPKKMKTAEAGDRKGDERKAFMSQCLKAAAPAAPMTQQDKMKKCNADASAKSLKGGRVQELHERVPEGGEEVGTSRPKRETTRARLRTQEPVVEVPHLEDRDRVR